MTRECRTTAGNARVLGLRAPLSDDDAPTRSGTGDRVSPSASPVVTSSLAYLVSTDDVSIAYAQCRLRAGRRVLGGFMSDTSGTKTMISTR